MRRTVSRATIVLAFSTAVGVAAAQDRPIQSNENPGNRDGAVMQQGGSLEQRDRAPDLKLTDAQKEELRKAVLAGDSAQQPLADFEASVGAKVPDKVNLHPMPQQMIERVPELKSYFFANIADRRIAIVNGISRQVVDTLALAPPDQTAAATGEPKPQSPSQAQPPAQTAQPAAEPGSSPGAAPAPAEAGKAAEADNRTAAAQSTAAQAAAEQNDKNADKALRSDGGKGGKAEPGAHAADNRMTEPVLVNGMLNAPGAPTRSQTQPAKFSPENDAIDRRPIMAGAAGLSEQERAEIYRAVMAADQVPAARVTGAPATFLPNLTEVHEWPAGVAERHPALASYRYVKTENRVLIVAPANKVVVGVIDKDGATTGAADKTSQ